MLAAPHGDHEMITDEEHRQLAGGHHLRGSRSVFVIDVSTVEITMNKSSPNISSLDRVSPCTAWSTASGRRSTWDERASSPCPWDR